MLGGYLDPWTQDTGGGAFDSTYDDFTDYGGGDYTDTGGYGDVGGYDDFTDYGDAGDYGDDSGGYDFGDTGDYGGYDDAGGYDDFTDYGDTGGYDDAGGYDDFTDYGDTGDYADAGGYDDFTDYGDAGDYADAGGYDDFTDYSDDFGAYSDEGASDYYGDEFGYDYGDDYSYDDSSDYSYDNSSDYSYDNSGDYDSGEYARGGPVRRRGKMARGPAGRPPSMRTGFRPRPVPGFRRGGPMPPPRGQRRLDPPKPMPGRQRLMGPPPAAAPMPGNFISPNGMQPPATGGMPAPGPQTRMPRAAPQIRPARPRPQHFAGGGQAGRRAEPTQGGFVSRELSPSGGSTTDDVNARLNAGEFVIPKDVAQWKGKEFFYKMIAQARKLRAGGDNEKPKVGYAGGGTFNPMQGGRPMMAYQTPAQIPPDAQMQMARGMRR